MFSTAQQAYIDALLPTYSKEGYKYYVVYTNTNTSGGFNTSADPDLYAVFSKKAISAQDAYTFNIEDSSIIVAVRCGNYSSSSYSNNSDRVVVEDYTAQTLSIEPYEHIYTNARFDTYALQPDYYLGSGGATNVQVQTISFAIFFIALFVGLSKLWFKR